MDETTLTRTLRDLASGAPVHTAPAADARRLAGKLQRRRRTGAAAVVVILALGVFGVARSTTAGHQELSGPAPAENWQVGLTEEGNPNHETAKPVLMPRSDGPEWAVYWQGTRPCWIQVNVTNQSSAGSECFKAVTTAPQPLAVVGSTTLPSAIQVVTDAQVATVRATLVGGGRVDVKPVTGSGFPYPSAVLDGKVVSVRALDATGKQIGDPAPGAYALQIRQVLNTYPCASPPTKLTLLVPDANDPTSCYDLSATPLSVAPRTVRATEDPALGNVVELTLNDSDSVAFGRLTQAALAAPEPTNQLAFVLGDKVLDAPTIQQAILNGELDIFSAGNEMPWTEAYTKQLAAELGG